MTEIEDRKKQISRTSALGIAVNIILAGAKIAIGAIASSVAIISEGVNNATDALSSVITLVGTKLAGKHPDDKHPFGYGRIEYLTGLVIAVLILVSGIELLISSVKLIFEPAELSVSYLSLIIVGGSAVVKFFLGLYTIRVGKKCQSGALEGVGLDCRNDSFASLITIASTIIFLVFGLSVDAYAGVITSAIIIKAGAEILLDTVSELIGRPGQDELAKKIYELVKSTDGVINAADMMLHNYGPDAYSGSVNIEVDHNRTIGELYQIIHKLQLDIMHKYNITMVFGMYAVDKDTEESQKLREYIAAFVRSKEHVKSYHAVYIDTSADTVYCDLIVDYKLKDWEPLREEFINYMDKQYPGKAVELTIETEFV